MSSYVREKVIRLPLDENDLKALGVKSVYGLEGLFPDLFSSYTPNKFQVAPTEKSFLDYVLECDDDCSGDWGRVRKLYESEKCKYVGLFETIVPFVKDIGGKLRLVEFCWYNCSEAPDYYDETEDAFYDEV